MMLCSTFALFLALQLAPQCLILGILHMDDGSALALYDTPCDFQMPDERPREGQHYVLDKSGKIVLRGCWIREGWGSVRLDWKEDNHVWFVPESIFRWRKKIEI